MIKLLYKIKRRFLTMFGDIKYFKYPFWLVYCPESYRAKGKQYREASKILKSGDVIIRGYKDYIDGVFIPGEYSHSSVYMGNQEKCVIHAVAEGVSRQDICDFLRCDRFCIMRPSKDVQKALKIAKSLLGKEYDFNFEFDNGKYYCHEFTATCYPNLKIDKILPTWMNGHIKGSEPVYLAQSFITSPDFTKVYEFKG